MGEGRTQIDSVEHSKHIFLLCVSRYATVILSDAFWRDSSDAEAGKTAREACQATPLVPAACNHMQSLTITVLPN